jgi:WD40 repeat protein/tRNA A-37 threonylcarbamoyl transferase component Bud32
MVDPPDHEGPVPDKETVCAPTTEGPGSVIGRYRLLDQIGEGGFGAVYVAEQREPVKRRVALKIIKLGMDTRQVVARFEAERQALALMDHPNIAKVFDAGATETGRPFFVMELVKGVRITDYCDKNQLVVAQRLELFTRVCQAIQHAHQKGIIHRDIKPSNILVTMQDGTPVPKVIDFGIAKATQQELTEKTLYTQLQQFVGTPAYMSPEQAELSGLDIDTRSDIYSLGVLLYELLTGSTPFDTKELLEAGLDALRKIIREREPMRPSTRLRQTSSSAPRSRPSTIHSQLSTDLDWIVMKCLEKDRTRRYETANGLAMDVQRHLNHEPVVARPPSQLYRLEKLVRRNKLAFAAIVGVASALVLGLALAASGWRQAQFERDRAVRAQAGEQAQRLEAQANELKAQAEELRARQRAYASDLNLAQRAISVNNLGRAQDLLNRQRPQAGQSDLRGWEWRYLWQECRSDALYELCGRPSGIGSVACDAQEKWLAIGGWGHGDLSVWDLEQKREIATLLAGDLGVAVAFSPAGSLLAFSYATQPGTGNPSSGIRFWDAETRQLTRAEIRLTGTCRGLVFAADGLRLITSTGDPGDEIAVWKLPEGTNLVRYPARQADNHGHPFATAADLSVAAWVEEGAEHGRVHVLDLATGKERWSVPTSDNFISTAVAISPGASLLASGGGYLPSPIRVYNLTTAQEVASLPGHEGWISTLVFSPDGKTLASAGSDQTVRLWNIADLPNVPPPRILRGHRLEVWAMTRFPGSGRLATGSKDGSVFIWDPTAPVREPNHFVVETNVNCWRFVKDGQDLVTLDLAGHVVRRGGTRFQNPESLMTIPVESLIIWREGAQNHSFSRDGGLLATASTNGSVQIWDLRHATLLRQFTNLGGPWPREFSQRNASLIVENTDDGSCHELDLATGRELRTWGTKGAWFSTVSPDLRWCLAVGASGLLKDLATGQETHLALKVAGASDLAFSPDRSLLAATRNDAFPELYATASWQKVATLTGFLQGIHSAAWSPDSRRLVTGSDGKEAIKLWDAASFEEVLTLEAAGELFDRTQFSTDGNWIGSRNDKAVLHLWHAPSWEEIEAAEKADR